MKDSFLKKLLFFFVLSFLMLASFTYGIVSVRRQHLPYKMYLSLYQQKRKIFSPEWKRDGIWHRVRNSAGDQELTDEQREAIAKISALPYLKGYNTAPDVENVTIYDKQAAYNGLNFVVSADAPKSFLMDMEGKVLHEWHKTFENVWPEPYDIMNVPEVYKTYWRRAYLQEQGDVLAMFMNYGLVKLDKDSNLLWSYKGRVHHDLFVVENGNIYVLTRELRKNDTLRLESLTFDGPVLEDFITILSPEGQEIRKFSLIDCFLNSDYASHLEHIKNPLDILHTNTIRRIDRNFGNKYPMFKKGHILVSMREIHTLAVIDPERERVIWALTGMWKYQHEPRLLENGNLLLFDNRGNAGKTKVIEFNPLTQEVVWMYKGEPAEAFYSREAGNISRLTNGNTLITESENGRAFEVTPEGKIVWEFFNPYRAGEENELIAALYDVVRYAHDQIDWLVLDATSE